MIIDGVTFDSFTVEGFASFCSTLPIGFHTVQFTIDGFLVFKAQVRVITTDVDQDVIDRYDDSYLTVRMTSTAYQTALMEAGLKAIIVFALPLPIIAFVVQKRLDSRSKRVV